MSYALAGPRSVTDGNPLDSPNGAVTSEGFDNFSLPYTVNFDTDWSLGWNYFPNDYSVPANAMVRFRLQPGSGALNVIMATREAGGDFADRNSGSIPYVLGEDIDLRPTRNQAGLISLMSGATTIVSATPPHPIVVNEGILHWGNTTPGSDMVLTNINYAEAGAITNVVSAVYVGQGLILVETTNIPTATHYGGEVGGEDADVVARVGDTFLIKTNAAIDALTPNASSDDPEVSGKLVRIWHGDL